MRPCANLNWLFNEAPMLERFGIARSSGFDAVEILFPYDLPAADVVDRLSVNHLAFALMNGPPPNYTGRSKGFAAIAGGEAAFEQDFKRAARAAKALGAEHLHLMAGVAEGPEAQVVYIRNLRWACEVAPDQSIVIEPINGADMPGYFLNSFEGAMEVIEAVDAPNLGLLFDTHHAHQITGDVLEPWGVCKSRVAHVQVADTPDRKPPGCGDIDWPALFAMMRSDGYSGWVCGEYTPAKDTRASLDWLTQLGDS